MDIEGWCQPVENAWLPGQPLPQARRSQVAPSLVLRDGPWRVNRRASVRERSVTSDLVEESQRRFERLEQLKEMNAAAAVCGSNNKRASTAMSNFCHVCVNRARQVRISSDP